MILGFTSVGVMAAPMLINGSDRMIWLLSAIAVVTIVIAGRPDLGHPDWRQVRHGQPLTDQAVSDVIAYLHSLRSDTPGQPYPEISIKR